MNQKGIAVLILIGLSAALSFLVLEAHTALHNNSYTITDIKIMTPTPEVKEGEDKSRGKQ